MSGMQGMGGMHGNADMSPEDMPEALDDETARMFATDLDYTELGAITRKNRSVSIEAVNKDGQPVIIKLNPVGEVLSETPR